MGFWIFMFCCDLLIPLVMIFAGRMMQYHPPREINYILGYRTARSMKNRETWVFAHRECGRLWQRWGWGELIATVVLMLLFLGEKNGIRRHFRRGPLPAANRSASGLHFCGGKEAAGGL